MQGKWENIGAGDTIVAQVCIITNNFLPSFHSLHESFIIPVPSVLLDDVNV